MNQFSSELIDKLHHLESHLHSHIKGQDHVIPRIASVLRRGELNLPHPSRPKGSLLFVGPTGVGKTEITLAFTEYLYGAGHLHRFDMSEFQNQSSVGLLLGSSPTDAGMLGRALAGQDRGTLLFDEMEKAHPLVLDLFFQMLDTACITLATGKLNASVVSTSFSPPIFVQPMPCEWNIPPLPLLNERSCVGSITRYDLNWLPA